MLVLEIDKTEYHCPQSWADVTLKQYCESVSVLDLMTKKLNTLTFGKEEERNKVELTNEDNLEFASFYKTWVSFWCGIPLEIVGKLPVETEGGFGVINLYSILLKFMVAPPQSECHQSDMIEYKGKKYMLPETLKTLNGQDQPMVNSSFDEFYEGAELKRIQGELKNGNAKVLPLLTAIMYRPAKLNETRYKFIEWLRFTIPHKKYIIEEYDSNKVKSRAALFSDLPMDKVWGAYFFFIQLKLTLLKNTLHSSKVEAEKPQRFLDMAGI